MDFMKMSQPWMIVCLAMLCHAMPCHVMSCLTELLCVHLYVRMYACMCGVHKLNEMDIKTCLANYPEFALF